MIRLLVTLLSVLLVVGAAMAQPPIEVTGEWVRLAPPGSHMTAGYLTIANNATTATNLVSVNSPQFDRVEMHSTSIVDGVARMEKLESLAIPPSERAVFEPGGLHLMLIGPRGSLTEGAEVTLYLVFDNGWEIEVDASVRRR